jgi:Zn-dependent protease
MDFSNLSTSIRDIALLVPGFLLAITVHEFAHGFIAYRLGDPTAKLAGRLTFNPISHLDPFGTLALVLTGIIGWAKPVPVDPRYLRNPRKDMLWISLGGPAANMIAAVTLALAFHAMVSLLGGMAIKSSLVLEPLAYIIVLAVRINVGLAVFNLLPVPPLDGSGILAGLLPRHMAYQFERLQPYGFIVLLLLIFSGAVGYLVIPPIRFIIGLLL